MATANTSSHRLRPKEPTPPRSDSTAGSKSTPTFCPTDVDDLFATVDWEVRSAQIKGENGELIFEQTNCEVPSFWSQLATNVVCQQVLLRRGRHARAREQRPAARSTASPARSPTGASRTATSPAPEDGERFYRELTWLCLHQHGAFNSPVWFNVGLYHQYGVKGAKCNWRWDAETRDVVQPENPYEYPQGSACFIQSVDDNMEDIMELARSEAMLFKFGRGTGTDLSTLRSHREKLAGGGKPSGPLSFMRVYDQVAAVVKSGGKTRRAAKMQSLKVWHPDVMEFIECKWKEEKKARVPDREGRLRGQLQRRGLQLDHVPEREPLGPRDRRVHAGRREERGVDDPLGHRPEAAPARRTRPATCWTAWPSAPGTAATPACSTTRRSTTGTPAPTAAGSTPVNPCSEYMFLDDTACNLASINLMKFRQADGTFDVERFKAACRIYFIAQEILVDHASYPTQRHRPEQPPVPPAGPGLLEPRQPADGRRACRTTRDAACGVCGAITALLHGAANLTSAELAAAVGPFDGYRREPRADAPRDADASRRGRGDQRRRARRTCRTRPADVWDEVLAAGARARLPQRPGHGARPDRHDQLHDGLRHDRHRAGHRPGEVQAARRRRHAEDRQPDRAAGAADARLRRAADRARSWPTSTSTTRSKARPT